jgi:hypothetical protein
MPEEVTLEVEDTGQSGIFFLRGMPTPGITFRVPDGSFRGNGAGSASDMQGVTYIVVNILYPPTDDESTTVILRELDEDEEDD